MTAPSWSVAFARVAERRARARRRRRARTSGPRGARCASSRGRSRSAARRPSAAGPCRRAPRPCARAPASARSRRLSRQRHRVGHADAALGRGEGRLEHVRALEVAALGLEGGGRLEAERAAALGVEDPREHRRRVDVRQAEPVDRAVPGDQRGGPAVADERVLANRRVAVDALHPPGFCRSARTRRRPGLWRDRHAIRHEAVTDTRAEAGLSSTSREAGLSPTR